MFENCLRWVVYTNTMRSPCIAWCLDMNGKLLKFLPILITTVYFKDRNRVSKTVHCISSLMVCKIFFCSEFSNIPDNAGRKTRRRRRRTQANQFVIFNPLSYCFEETIEFDVKASFASRPVSRLIR